MALTAQVLLNTTSYTAGATPPPVANILVANSGALAVSVVSVQMQVAVQYSSQPQFPTYATNLPATGPGQNVSVPAGGTLTIGPFPIAIGSAAFNSPYAGIPPGSVPTNQQPSQPIPVTFIIGANILTSDLSTTAAGSTGLLVAATVQPPLGNFGGFLQFNGNNNLLNGLVLGVV